MMNKILVRRADLEDAAAINGIYNPYIKTSPATFETSPYSTDKRRKWLSEHLECARHPVFVAQSDGAIIGFANASRFDPREAYETSVKTSVFVAPEFHGKGAGKKLYTRLFEALAGAGLHRAYALIVAPNAASARLHESFGFRHISTLSEVGRKFGRYYDVMWFEKAL